MTNNELEIKEVSIQQMESEDVVKVAMGHKNKSDKLLKQGKIVEYLYHRVMFLEFMLEITNRNQGQTHKGLSAIIQEMGIGKGESKRIPWNNDEIN